MIVSLLVGGGAGYGIAQFKTPTEPTHVGTSDSAPAMSGEHSMDSSMSSMLSDLKKQTGDARDAAFLESMIVHHQGAIDMAQLIAGSTKRPELKKMAEDIINAQTSEITTMQGWLTQWFGR